MNAIRRLSTILIVWLLSVGMLAGFLLPASADIEPINNDLNTTEIIAPSTPMPGALNSTDNDYYKFSVTSAQNISVKAVFDSGTGTIYCDLFGPDKSRIGGTGSFNVGLTNFYNYSTSAATAGDYYVKLASSGTAFYNVTVTLTMQNDAGSGTDAGNADTNPFPVTNGTYNGFIGNDDAIDYYSIAVVNAQVLTLNFTTGTLGSNDLYLDLFGPDKSRITGTGNVNPGVSKGFNYTTSLTTGGIYYLKVAGGYNAYTFKVQLTNQNDLGLGLDAFDTDVSPTIITTNITGEGWIADMDAKDYYGFEVEAGKNIVVALTAGTAGTSDLYVDLYTPAKDRLLGTGNLNPGISKTISYTTSSANPGIYYVFVAGGRNTYTLSVELISQNDGGSLGDAPDDYPGVLVTGCAPCGGWIAGGDTKDYYGVMLTNGQRLTLNFTVGTVATSDLYMDLYNPLKNRLVGTGNVNAGVTESVDYTSSIETSGLYYFFVAGGANDYNITMTVEDQDDADSGKDVPEGFDDSVELETGSYTGRVEDADVVDMYNVTVSAGNVFTVNITTATGDGGTVTATVFDPERNSVGGAVSAPGVKATWSLSNDDVSDSDTTYYVKVISTGGNSYTLEIDLPQVPPDTTLPSVLVLSPPNNHVTKNSVVSVSGTAWDTVGEVMTVKWLIGNGTEVDCTGTTNWSCSLTLNDEGPTTITIKAFDGAVNMGMGVVTIVLDTTEPELEITSPANATTTMKGTALTVSGSASDLNGVAMVEVMVNGGNWTQANGTTMWSLPVTLVSGPNTILVKATDIAGNTDEKTYTVTSEKEKSNKKSSPGFEGALLVGAVVAGMCLLMRRARK